MVGGCECWFGLGIFVCEGDIYSLQYSSGLLVLTQGRVGARVELQDAKLGLFNSPPPPPSSTVLGRGGLRQ